MIKIRMMFVPILLSFLTVGRGAEITTFTHPGALHTTEDLDIAWEHAQSGQRPWAPAWEALARQAEDALKVEPSAPDVFAVPARYEDAEGHARERARLSVQTRAAYNLALAASLLSRSGDPAERERGEVFARHALAILMEWTRCRDMGENTDPFIRRETALVTCSTGNGLILAADLLYDHPAWARADRDRFLDWVRGVVVPASTIKTISYNNNWNTWGVYLSLLCAHLLEDGALFAEGAALWKRDLTHHIKPDGRMPKELARGGGKNWYTYYALTPITTAGVAIRNATGEDPLDPSTDTGLRVKAGLDYFFEHLKGHDYRSLMEAAGDLYRDRAYMDWNLGRRPVIGLDHHTGWVHPTLFLRWETLPVNHPPKAVLKIRDAPAKVGEPLRLDAGASSDPDGDAPLAYLWYLPGGKETVRYGEPLMSGGDVLWFPEPLGGRFELGFTLVVRDETDMVAGLQPSTRSGFGWGASSFQLNVKDGRFRVRDGNAYRVTEPLGYVTGEPVRFRLEVDPAGKRFSVFARRGEGEETTLAKDFSPRGGSTDFTDIAKFIYTGREGVEITNVELVRLGRTLSGSEVELTFNEPGTHRVRLTVTDPHGATDSVNTDIEVR